MVRFIGFRPKKRVKKTPKVKYRDNRIPKEEQEQPAKVIVVQEDPEDIEEEEIRVVSPIYAPPAHVLEEEEIAKEDSKDSKELEIKEEVAIKEKTIKVEKPKRKKRKYTRRKKKAKTTEVSEPEPLIPPLELSNL